MEGFDAKCSNPQVHCPGIPCPPKLSNILKGLPQNLIKTLGNPKKYVKNENKPPPPQKRTTPSIPEEIRPMRATFEVNHHAPPRAEADMSIAKQLAPFALAAALVSGATLPASAFDLSLTLQTPEAYTAHQLSILTDAIAQAEALWEGVITGYQPDITIPSIPIEIRRVTTGLAAATFSTTTHQGGFRLTTSGFINLNFNQIETFAAWPRDDLGNGLNFIDDLLAHEIGHVLGIGTLWDDNNAYTHNTFQYTGSAGLAAYRAEFDPDALFIPVENAGNAGTINSHWDQLIRSSTQEGNPDDPFSISPLLGIVDVYGRDLGLELMSGALDPDFGEPFLSNTTIQSMRDLGYTVIPEPSALLLLTSTALFSLSRRRAPSQKL